MTREEARAMGRTVRLGCLILMLSAVASAAYAQGTLAGVVRDATGAVLPGVTVEAASPAPIERVRTTVTDASGQYRIIDLRGGAYVVTFTLAGFTTARREDVR